MSQIYYATPSITKRKVASATCSICKGRGASGREYTRHFGRLQDHIRQKPIPRFAESFSETKTFLLDVLVHVEQGAWLDSAETLVGPRKPRKLLTYRYMADSGLFWEALQATADAALMSRRRCGRRCLINRGPAPLRIVILRQLRHFDSHPVAALFENTY